MRRSIGCIATISIMLMFAAPVAAAEGDPGTVTIMNHACTEEPVKDQADFDAIVAQAKGDETTALALTVVACPTIIQPDDTFSDGIHGPAVAFDFTVTDANGDTQTLGDAEFMTAKLCEPDIDRDVNGDGEMTADVCLDTSNYVFTDLAVGKVTVKETAPNGWRFGTLLLTPQGLQTAGSNDALTSAAFDASASTVTLDLSGDPDDGAMLHIYNFEQSPATDTISGPAPEGPPIVGLLAGLLTLLGGAMVLRRRTA